MTRRSRKAAPNAIAGAASAGMTTLCAIPCQRTPFEPSDRLLELRRRPQDHVALRTRGGVDLRDPVADDVPRRLVDVVADVVEGAREAIHVVAVERRHEGAVQEVDDLVREPVALVLELLDVPHPLLRPVERVRQKVDERPGDCDRVRRGLVVEVEELLALGNERDSRHRRLLPGLASAPSTTSPRVEASEAGATVTADAGGKPSFPGVLWSDRAELREPVGARVREGPRLLRRAVGLRAEDVRARARRGGAGRGGLHPRLPPPRAGSLPRDHDDEAVARDAEEPQAEEAPRAVSERPDQALLQARRRATGPAIPPRARVLTAPDPPVGEVYLSAEDIAARVQELGVQIAADYEGREPLLVAALKASL